MHSGGSGCLLLTVLLGSDFGVVLTLCSYFMLNGVGVSCHISYSVVSYLYVSCSGEERAIFSAIVYL